MHNTWISLLLCSFFCFTLNNACAKPLPVLTLSGAAAWYQAGQTQTLALQPALQNKYIAKTKQQVLASGEVFLGVQQRLPSNVQAHLGVALVTTSAAQLQGHVWETADPTFNNFTYQYNIHHTHVALKGKVLSAAFSTTCLPYISGSLGVGFNRSSQFSMKSLSFEAIPPAAFEPNTQTAFTYTLGAGVQKNFSQHMALGLGYERADWGSSMLARAPGQTLGTGLVLNHLYTHQLQLSISYLA